MQVVPLWTGLAGLGLGCAGYVRPSPSAVVIASVPLDTMTLLRRTPLPAALAQRACLPETATASELLTQTSGSIAGKVATVHWPDRRNNPIRVWVQAAPTLAGWDNDDRTIVAKAFHAWDKAGLPVHFFFINSAAGADVVVRWIDKFPTQHEGWTTMWWDRDGWIQNGDMVLALHAPSGRTLTPIELQALATHEAGHVLGLAHLTDSTTVMASTVYSADVTWPDVTAAQSLYAAPPGRSMTLRRADGRSAAKIGHVAPCPWSAKVALEKSL